MTSHRPIEIPPRQILLATDLSARCDRAQDRAVMLAKEWQAELVVLHVMEPSSSELLVDDSRLPSWRRQSDPVTAVYRRLARDIGEGAPNMRIVVERGNAVDVVLDTAEKHGCDLIVTGIARDEFLGRLALGNTVDQVSRNSRVPILTVRDRPHAPYRSILAASDFSVASSHAVSAAARMFPKAACTLFHAYDAPLASRVVDTALYNAETRSVAEQEARRFLEGVAVPAGWQVHRTVIERGSPATLLRDFASHEGTELIVLGSRGNGALFEILIGSTAREILDMAPCDTLLVRDPENAA